MYLDDTKKAGKTKCGGDEDGVYQRQRQVGSPGAAGVAPRERMCSVRDKAAAGERHTASKERE